ncbi:MAG: hypothetical protein ACE5HT_09545 [Gemmatimonadales bacterium]
MMRPTLTVTLLAIALSGCSKKEAAPPPVENQASQPTASEPEAAPAAAQAPAPEPTFTTRVVRAGQEEPWAPTDTGTINPGMSREEVIATWGEPVVERSNGNWSYLYFRNGCENACGTFDVVFLDGNQVVDAIVRGEGHTYSGVSSSPPDREAVFTPPDSAAGLIGS